MTNSHSRVLTCSHYAICLAGVAALYFMMGRLGLLASLPPGFATIIWPPSGLALAAFLMYGRKISPGVFIGSFLLNMGVVNGDIGDALHAWEKMTIPAEIALGSTVQALVTCEIVTWLCRRNLSSPSSVVALESWPQLCLLAAIIVPVGCCVAATAGVSAIFYGGVITAEHVVPNWLTWWFGDTMGVIIFTPAFLLIPGFSKKVFWKGSAVAPLPVLHVYTLLVPLGITFYAFVASSHFLYNKGSEAFSNISDENLRALIYRIDSYEYALQAGAGFFSGSENVTAEEWRSFVNMLNVEKNFQGVNGFGWINRVEQKDVPKFVSAIRQEKPDFTVHPDVVAEQAQRYIITYLEPVEYNKPAIGLDIAFEENRRIAADLARDTGHVVLTKKITLVQDTEKSAGFLLLSPLYKKGKAGGTLEDRRKNLTGWIYAPFVAKKFMNDLTGAQGKYLNLRVYDGKNIDDSALIYDSNKYNGTSREPKFSVKKSITVKQTDWTIVWESTPAFEEQVHSYEPLLIIVGGGFLTIIFAAFLYSLCVRTDIIRKLVDEKTLEIQHQKQQLQMIFDNVPARIWYKDNKNNMLKLNHQAAESMGGTVEQFEGKNAADFFPSMAEKYLRDDLEAINSGKPLLGIVETYAPVGKNQAWVRTDKVPFVDSVSGQKTLLVVSQDITDKKIAEDKLKESEERYNLVVKGMNVGVWDWNIGTGESFWSNKFKKIMGIIDPDYIETNAANFVARIHPDDLGIYKAGLEEHFNKHTRHVTEFRLRHEDGHYIWVRGSGQAIWDDDGRPVRMAGSMEDITERKVAEEALVRSEELNTLAVRGMSVGLWDWDIQADVISTSYKLHEVLGDEASAGLFQNMDFFVERIYPDDRETFRAALNRHLQERHPFDVEYKQRREGGEYVWVQACGQAKWDENGVPIRMVGSIANIDARKRAEEKLVRSNEELESFAYIASHDLQEPLRMVHNFTELLKEEYWNNLDEQAREYMGHIISGAKHMQDLVRDLLEYARVDKDDTEEQDVDCNQVMKRIEVNLYQVISETGAKILYEKLPVIKANPVQVVSLFQNLVGNGIKYSHKGAVPCVSITVTDQGHQWLFSVMDNGIGIKGEFLEQIFVAFKRLHNRSEYKGTGVGLAICKKIVENLDGEIWAESEYGHGSVFNFTIPKKYK